MLRRALFCFCLLFSVVITSNAQPVAGNVQAQYNFRDGIIALPKVIEAAREAVGPGHIENLMNLLRWRIAGHEQLFAHIARQVAVLRLPQQPS